MVVPYLLKTRGYPHICPRRDWNLLVTIFPKREYHGISEGNNMMGKKWFTVASMD